jgi:hypothetical protein
MIVFNIIAGALAGCGLFLIFCDLLRVPTLKTSQTMIGAERQFRTKESRINSTLDDVAKKIASWLHLRDHKKAQLQADLNTARIDVTPEMFVATNIVKAGVVAVLSIPLFLIIPIAGLVFLIGAFVYYLLLMDELKKKVVNHRKELEFELTRMIFTIERTLQHDRNVILMLQNYREIAGPEMKQELDITIADMLSGNHEQAISRLEIRVGSIMMSDVCRGLISVIRGDDTASYWISLQQKFMEHQRSMLRSKAEKIPQRVGRLSMILLFAFMALWLGALIMQMIQAFSELFQAI